MELEVPSGVILMVRLAQQKLFSRTSPFEWTRCPLAPCHVGNICSCGVCVAGDLPSTLLAYSGGSAHTGDYLFQLVPELTKEAYVVTNELETNVTNCHCQQTPGLAVPESYGGTSDMLHDSNQ